MLLDSESGHFDYSIEKQLEKETSSEQIAVDVEATKVNLYKAPMELNVYRSQNESEEGDYSPKRRETTHLIVQELPKPPTLHRKGNDIVNLALIEIDPSKVLDKSNMKINPMQKDEIIVPAKQILANQPTLNYNTEGKEIVTGSNAIKIINKRSFSSLEDNRNINPQKVISEGTRHEFLKEQDREAPRVRFKTIKMSKENPYVNNSLASNMFKEKAHELDINEIKNLLLNITSRLNNEPVGSSSRVPGMDINRKGLLQKELTLKIGCHNINRLKTNQQKFKTLGQWLDDKLNPQIFGLTVAVEKNRKHHKIVYLYDQTTTENWEDFRLVLDKKLQKEKTTLNKLSDTNNIKNRKGSC
ncbi:23205_t:CDS:2 [Gigaspora margarita]|uniref:23205_t:CDS:1 n=1 Tax=Gigaspora margarita TaxID=4874 RepID=A0ABN7V782_GIGMA|nr:23205_t:CDS:2 [Gigaspora margarita]